MATRWNGRDLGLDRALEEGLFRRGRAASGGPRGAREHLLLLQFILDTSRRLTPNDQEILRNVLSHATLADAAREMRPDSEGYRPYVSGRVKQFQTIAHDFIRDFLSLLAPSAKDLEAPDVRATASAEPPEPD